MIQEYNITMMKKSSKLLIHKMVVTTRNTAMSGTAVAIVEMQLQDRNRQEIKGA